MLLKHSIPRYKNFGYNAARAKKMLAGVPKPVMTWPEEGVGQGQCIGLAKHYVDVALLDQRNLWLLFLFPTTSNFKLQYIFITVLSLHVLGH